MKVTKLFEITLDEPEQDYLSGAMIKMILATAMFEEGDKAAQQLRVRDLTNREQYEEIFAKAVVGDYEILEDEEDKYIASPLNDVIEDSENHGPHDDLEESVQERNERLRAQNEKKVGPPHTTPGKGTPCGKPEIFKDKLRGGGAISFCPACGFQYSDSDLIQ